MHRFLPIGFLLLAACASAPPRGSSRTILSATGPLPVAADFECDGGRQTLLLSASAWSEDEDVRLEVQTFVDGALVARCRLFSNAAATHRALVCPAVPLQLAPGRHRIELRPGNDETVTDQEDLFEATLVER